MEQERCSIHGSQEAKREGRIQGQGYTFQIPLPMTYLQQGTTSQQHTQLLNTPVDESNEVYITSMIHSSCKSSTPEHIRVLGDISYLNYNVIFPSGPHISSSLQDWYILDHPWQCGGHLGNTVRGIGRSHLGKST